MKRGDIVPCFTRWHIITNNSRYILYRYRIDPVPFIGNSFKGYFGCWYKRPRVMNEARQYYAGGRYSNPGRSPKNLPDPWDDRIRGDVGTRKSWKNKKIRKQYMKGFKKMDFVKNKNYNDNYLKPEELKDGYLYKIDARNASYGVWVADKGEFVISRYKFGMNYLFEEVHWDLSNDFGTVKPLEEVEKCPFNLNYINEVEMLEYLNGFIIKGEINETKRMS